MPTVHASSFADPADVLAYQKAKARGLSDADAFKFGDNGLGCWGDFTAQLLTPMCALPPEVMVAKWRSIKAAKHKRVIVTDAASKKSVVCILADRMPRLANIKNGCGIDLNPAACKALALTPPIKRLVRWEWEVAAC